MSNRSALPILLLMASCSGHLPIGGLLGNSSSSSSSQAASPESSAASSGASESGVDYDFSSPPVSKTDRNLLTMPKFFQAGRIAWAWTRSPWTGFWLADVLGDQLGEHARLRLV